jgi:hypothetical protein
MCVLPAGDSQCVGWVDERWALMRKGKTKLNLYSNAARRPPCWSADTFSISTMTNSSSLINIIYLYIDYCTYYDSKNYNIIQINTLDSWLSVEFLFDVANLPPCWNKAECRHIFHQHNDKFFFTNKYYIFIYSILYLIRF